MDTDQVNEGEQIKDASPRSKRKAYRQLIKDRGDDPGKTMHETKAEILESAMQRIVTRPITEVADFSKCRKLTGGSKQGGGGMAASDDDDDGEEQPKQQQKLKRKRDRCHTPAQLRRAKKQRESVHDKPVLPNMDTVMKRRMEHLMDALRPAPSFAYIRL